MSEKKEAIKYSSSTLAVILIIAIAIGTFMYTILTRDSDVNDDYKLVNGFDVEVTDSGVNPGGHITPTHPPEKNPIPTTPPPVIPGVPEGY